MELELSGTWLCGNGPSLVVKAVKNETSCRWEPHLGETAPQSEGKAPKDEASETGEDGPKASNGTHELGLLLRAALRPAGLDLACLRAFARPGAAFVRLGIAEITGAGFKKVHILPCSTGGGHGLC